MDVSKGRLKSFDCLPDTGRFFMKQAVDPYASFRELTLRGMILGALITVIFTASNVYLGLKVA